jgi:hypothetical protein
VSVRPLCGTPRRALTPPALKMLKLSLHDIVAMGLHGWTFDAGEGATMEGNILGRSRDRLERGSRG